MNLVLLTVGKPKAAYLAACLDDYATRLKPQGGCALDSVRQVKPQKGQPPGQASAQEAQALLGRLEPRDQVWALEPGGQGWSSEQWAQGVDKAREAGARRLVLVIGGPDGLAPALLARADHKVSLGPITLPHELAACVALEQLYRAHAILAGSPYHRA